MLLACGSDSDGGENGASGDAFGCMFDSGLFEYCGEYRGVDKKTCEQSGGTYYDECPEGAVGKCELKENVNPKRTYFYGDAVTKDAVAAVCPGGTYELAGASSSASGGNGNSSNDCNDLANDALAFTQKAAPLEDAPTLKGGAIVAGTYRLTGFTWFGAPDGFVPSRHQGKMTISGGTRGNAQTVDASDGNGLVPCRNSYTYAANGALYTLTNTCGTDVDLAEGTFAATPTRIELLLDDPTNGKVLWTYSR